VCPRKFPADEDQRRRIVRGPEAVGEIRVEQADGADPVIRPTLQVGRRACQQRLRILGGGGGEQLALNPSGAGQRVPEYRSSFGSQPNQG
jgi:hypothetical protein